MSYDSKKFWDGSASYFCEHEFSWRKNLQKEHEVLFRWIDELKPKSVLQVGIGFGREIKELMKRDYIEHLDGVDVSPEMIKYAKDYTNYYDQLNPVFLDCDIVDLPFVSMYDLVFTQSCLTHVEEIDRALHKLIRASKKDIIISEIPAKNGIESKGIYRPDIMSEANHFNWNYEKRLSEIPEIKIIKKEHVSYEYEFILIHAQKVKAE